MVNRYTVQGIVPRSPGAERRYRKRRAPGSVIPPSDKYKQVQTSDLWQQKMVDEKESLAMLVEELAKLDEFEPKTHIDSASFSRLPVETQLDMVRKLAEEVRTAPRRKQEDAQRNFVQQLAVGAGHFGKSAWDAVMNPTYIPGYEKSSDWFQGHITEPLLKAVDWSGREAASTIIKDIEGLMAGEQKHERRQRLYREKKQRDKPGNWWDRLGNWAIEPFNSPATYGFGPEGSEFAEPGFDVPMGVHLPLEIIFDPANLIGAGMISKGVKGVSRLTRAGRAYARAEADALMMQTAFDKAQIAAKTKQGEILQKQFDAQVRYNADLIAWQSNKATETNPYVYVTTTYSPTTRGTVRRKAVGGSKVASRRRMQKRVDRDYEEIYGDLGMGRGQRMASRRHPKGPKRPGPIRKRTQQVLKEPKAPFEYGRGADAELLPNLSRPRGNPNDIRRGLGTADEAEFSALWDLTLQEGIDPVNRWVMQAHWWFGPRTGELANVKMSPQVRQMRPGIVSPYLSMPMRGKANNRHMFGGPGGGAYKFMQEWLKVRQSFLSADEVDFMAKKGWINAPDTDMSDVFFVRINGVNQPATAKNVNIIFADAAKQYGKEGEELLDFYRLDFSGKGNNNFGYVWRLAAASRWMSASRRSLGRARIMQAMGHSSPRHTARYVSHTLFEHGSVRDAFKQFGFDIDILDDWTGVGGGYQTEGAIGKFFSKLPGGAKMQDVRADLQNVRTNFLLKHIADEVVDIMDIEGATVVSKLPTGLAPKTAQKMHELEELETFMYYLQDVIEKKGFINKTYGNSKEQIRAAEEAISILRSWRQPVVDAATTIADDIGKLGDPLMPLEALETHTGPFGLYQAIITADLLSESKFAGLGRGRNTWDFLSGKLPRDVITASELTDTGKVRYTTAARLARMSQDELDALNVQLAATGEATIPNTTQRIKPGMPGLHKDVWDVNNPNQLALKDARLGVDNYTGEIQLSAGYLVRYEGKESLGKTTWIVTRWTFDDAGNYNGASLRKLAAKPTDPKTGWKLRYARDQGPSSEQWVPITKLKEWRLIDEAPISVDPASDVFTSLRRSGRKTLEAEDIARYFFVSGKWDDAYGWKTMQELRANLSVVGPNEDLIDMGLDAFRVPSPGRLRNSNLLEVEPGTSGHKTRYRWKKIMEDGSDSVEMALNRDIDANLSDYKWGAKPIVDETGAEVVAGGRIGMPPGSTPTAEAAGWPFSDDWNKLMFGNLGIHEVIVLAHGMDQPGKIFSGEGWGRKLFAMLDEEKGAQIFGTDFKVSIPRWAQQWARMLVPGTWGASPGGRLVWTYRVAGLQHGDIADTVTMQLQNSFANARILDDTWSGENIRLTSNAADRSIIEEFVQVKAAKKKLKVEDTTWEDAGKADFEETKGGIGHGEEPKEGTFKARSKDEGGNPAFYDEVTGEGIILNEPHPYNVTRFRLHKKFQYENPNKWDDIAIREDERTWTYAQNTQYVGTFLATPRGHLSRYYVMTPELQQAWDHYHQVQRQLAIMFEASGHSLDEIMGEKEWLDEFVPLLPTGKMAEDPTLGLAKPTRGRAAIGAKPATYMDRAYDSHIQGKMMQGQVYGRTMHDVYNNNPLAALSRTITHYYDFVLDHQFLDAYSKLGLDMSAKMQPQNFWAEIIDPYRKMLIKSGRAAAEATLDEIPNAKLERIIKLFGPDWKSNTPEVNDRLRRVIGRYRNANEASENVGLNQGLNYVVDNHAIKNIAYDMESSHELMVLGTDMIDPVDKYLSAASAASNIMRVFATGADLGVLLLHGFGALGTMLSPTGFLPRDWSDWSKGMAVPWEARKAWGVGAYNMGRAMKQQIMHGKGATHNVRREWYINTIAEREEMRKYGVSFFRSTFSEDLPTEMFVPKTGAGAGVGYELRKKQMALGVEQAKIAPTVQRVKDIVTSPIDGFGFFLDVSKTEMWRAYKGTGLDTANDLSELAASLNAIHGTLNPSVAGVQYKQRVFESAILSYAAMYRRSALALINNAMNPAHLGTAKAWRRGPALHAVSGMVAAGAAFGWAIMQLQESGFLEKNDNLWNPGTPDFLAMKIGGLRFGIGTPYYSFMRAGTDIVNQMKDDPSGMLPVSFTDNPLMRWGRSQSSPLSSAAIDLLQGATFINEPLHTEDSGWEVSKIGDRLGRTLIPFWIESALHSDTRSFRGSLGELMGLRVSPLSPYSRLLAARNLAINMSDDPEISTWRQSQLSRGLPVTSHGLPRLLLSKLMDQNPELLEIEKEMSEQVQLRGQKARKEQDSFITAVNANREAADRQLLGVSSAFTTGTMSGKAFREAVTEIEVGLRAANRQVAGDHKDVLDMFEERRADRADRDAEYFVGDIVYDLYRETVTNSPELHDAYGNFRMDVFLQKQDKFIQEHAEEWPYVKERINENKQMPGAVGEFYQAKEILKDYWNLDETIWGRDSWQVELLSNWRTLQTREGKELFESTNRRVGGLLRKLEYKQRQYRRQNPTIDRLLVQFYDYAPTTSLGQTVQKGRILAAGLRQ